MYRVHNTKDIPKPGLFSIRKRPEEFWKPDTKSDIPVHIYIKIIINLYFY